MKKESYAKRSISDWQLDQYYDTLTKEEIIIRFRDQTKKLAVTILILLLMVVLTSGYVLYQDISYVNKDIALEMQKEICDKAGLGYDFGTYKYQDGAIVVKCLNGNIVIRGEDER